MDADMLLSLAQAVVTALAAVPNPAVVAVAAALGAALLVYRKYRATKAVDPAEVMDAAAKAQAAAKALEAALPKKPAAVEPKFDADSFGGMTAAEKAKK